MINIYSRNFIFFALSFIFISLFVFGCGGGGGSSTLSFFDAPSNISVKLTMMNRTSNAAYVSIPSNAVGTVNISVVSIKSGKEVANQNVDYSLSAFTFDNQIPAGDTYSVVVTARLKERANDIYESIWQGAGKVTVLNAEKAAKTPGANEVAIALSFITIEYIKLYPTKIIFDPAMPVAEITTSTLIPSFKLSVLDQFGNVMTSENSLITVGLENGSFKDSLYSKNLINGSVYFSNLAVASLIPDSAGYVKLKASYGLLTGYSSPVKTAGVAIPDSAVAGYLDDGTAAAAPSAPPKSNAPLANKTVKLVCNSLQYITTTDASGFFRFDVKAGGDNVAAYIEFVNAQGVTVKLSTTVSGGRMKLARIVIDSTGAARLLSSTLAGAYNSAIDAAQLKKAVDDEIASKSASGSAAGVSGVALDSATGQPIPSAVITIGQLGLSSQTDAAGRFSIIAAAGQLAAGEYVISFSRTGYLSASKSVSVSSFDYGFLIDAVTVEAPARLNAPPSIAIKSVSGASQNISIVFDLFDADGDPCNIDVQYSLNGGYSYLPTVNAGGSLANAAPGSGLSAVWFSASDFLTSQASVRIKLIPRDNASTGSAGESAIFAVNNEIVDPENNPPVIMGVMASGAAGDIAVSYDLIDQDGDSCAVELYYSLDGGATFTRSASYSIYNQRAFPAAGLSFVWNSALDFQTEEMNVKLRLTPNDSKSGGTPGESGVFTVNNIKNTPPVIQNLSVSGNYKDISLTFDLIELDGHLCTVEVAYSIDGGASYMTTAHLSGETSGVAAGQAKTLIWHSFYEFTSTNKSVFVKLTPSDKYGYGTEAAFGPFDVNNGGGTPSIANLNVSGTSQIIDILYELIDIDASASTVEVYFSLDGGSSFKQTGYVEGDILAVTPGAGKSIKWNSYGDFRTRESNVVLKLLPIDSMGAGTESVSLPFEINNNVNRPTVANIRTKGDSGEIMIAYDIDDLDGSTCQVMLQYSTEKSGGYLSSMFVTGETAEVYSGVDKTLTWNSKGDLSGNFDSVSVKLIVFDNEGSGAEAVSVPFKVYNNSTSSIFINSVAGGSQNITVDFNLTDIEGDLSNIEFYYSRDGGAAFIKTANVSGSVSNVAPANNLTLVWQSGLDIVNQNASGVLLKIAALDSNGALQSEKISQPFTVNNYIPPVTPPMQVVSAEFTKVSSSNAVKINFNAQVDPSSIIDISKLKIGGEILTPSSPKLNAPGGRNFAFYGSTTISGSSIIISPVDSMGFGNQDYIFGVTGDFVAIKGLEIMSGSGIKNTSGMETQPTAAPMAISRRLSSPAEPSPVHFSNATKLFEVPETWPLNTSVAGYIDIYIGASAPADSTAPLASSDTTDTTYHVFSVTLDSSYPPGNHVYYRFVSSGGTVKGAWADFGAIPDPVSVFEVSGAPNISWSNIRSEADVLSNTIGQSGDLISLYQYDQYGDQIYLYLGVSNAAPEGGFSAGSYSVTDNSSPVSVTGGNQFVFTLSNINGVESNYYTAATMLYQPPAELNGTNMAIKNNSGAYQLKPLASDVILTKDVRVYTSDNVKIARIPAGTYAAGSFITSYSETNSASSVNSFTTSGALKFTSVDSYGNESASLSGPDVDIINPAVISWSNAGVSDPFIKLTTMFGATGETIQIFAKSGSVYTPNGSILAGALGFVTTNVAGAAKIPAGNTVAYVYVNTSGNESPILDDGLVPGGPEPSVVSNLRLIYNSGNYEIKNTGSTVNFNYNLGVWVGTTGIGVVDRTVSPGISGASFPAANSYINSSKSPASLDDGIALAGGNLQFTYLTGDGNESDLYDVSAVVPGAPSSTDLSAARIRYDASMAYKLFAYQAPVTIAAGTRIYIGGHTALNSAVADSFASAAYSSAANALDANPDGTGGELGFTVSANGNESTKYYAGAVPDRPDIGNITWHNAASAFKFQNVMGTSEEKLSLYQKDGSSYLLKGSSSVTGPYNSGTEYTVSGTPPLIIGGKEAAYTMVNGSSGHESMVSVSAVVPAAPQYAEDLRVGYDGSGSYRVKNISTSQDFSIPAGQIFNVYIGSIHTARPVSASITAIPANGGFGDFELTQNSGGGALKFTLTDDASGNESEAIAPTTVPPFISYQATVVPADENGSGNSQNYINNNLAMSVLNPVSAPSPTEQLQIAFNTTATDGTAILELINPNDAGQTANLSGTIVGPSGNQNAELTLITGTPGSTLIDALGADGGVSFLASNLWIENASGNASTRASGSGLFRYDTTAPFPAMVTATLAVDGVFNHNGTDKLEIVFPENVYFTTAPGESNIFFPVTGDGFGGGGSSFATTATTITVTAPDEGGANSGSIKQAGIYNSTVTAAGSASGIYFTPSLIKDAAGNYLISPISSTGALDVQ